MGMYYDISVRFWWSLCRSIPPYMVSDATMNKTKIMPYVSDCRDELICTCRPTSWFEAQYTATYFRDKSEKILETFYEPQQKFTVTVMRSVGPLAKLVMLQVWTVALQWLHNERDGASNHRRLHCLLNCWFRHRSRKTSKLRVTGLCARNSPVTGEFPQQKASNAEKVSIW